MLIAIIPAYRTNEFHMTARLRFGEILLLYPTSQISSIEFRKIGEYIGPPLRIV